MAILRSLSALVCFLVTSVTILSASSVEAVAIDHGFEAGEEAEASHPPQDLKVIAPPDAFWEIVEERDRFAARQFYKKYLDVGGLPVVASQEVADEALLRTYEIVTHLLAGRPDILKAMHDTGMYLIIIGKDQVYTDMPEYRDHPTPDFVNERVRGTGGKPTSFGEENLLGLALDRYDDESIGVHEFCHTIDSALESIDPTWRERLNETYREVRKKRLYEGAYAGTNPGEYWAEYVRPIRLQSSQQLQSWTDRNSRTIESLRSNRL